jgi:hypothetical protein
LKDKRDGAAFERAKGIVASLQGMAQAGQCDLLYFDESGFSPNPPLQYGWTPIGHTRCAETGVHRQRVNVLGALGHDGKLLWTIKEQAKYFWRKFVRLTAGAQVDEVNSIMKNYGTEFTIKFR